MAGDLLFKADGGGRELLPGQLVRSRLFPIRAKSAWCRPARIDGAARHRQERADDRRRRTSLQVIYDPGVTLLDTWRALEGLVDEGSCRSIGLSDITLPTLRDIVADARIKPAVVQVESHPYLPEWELLEFCLEHGIVLLAFAPLGHGLDPKLLDDPVITNIARRVNKTPAQVALAWAVQRGTAFLTTSTKPDRIRENFDIATLPDDAMREIRHGIGTTIRFNSVVGTGVPGFIPRAGWRAPPDGDGYDRHAGLAGPYVML